MNEIQMNLGSGYRPGDYFMVAVFEGNSPTASRVGDAWFNLADENPTATWADPLLVNTASTDPAALEAFLEQAQVDRLPTVLFMQVTPSGGFEIITRLRGEQNYNKIAQTMRLVASGNTSEWFDGNNPDGSIGLGLFNLNPLTWLGIAAAALLLLSRNKD